MKGAAGIAFPAAAVACWRGRGGVGGSGGDTTIRVAEWNSVKSCEYFIVLGVCVLLYIFITQQDLLCT